MSEKKNELDAMLLSSPSRGMESRQMGRSSRSSSPGERGGAVSDRQLCGDSVVARLVCSRTNRTNSCRTNLIEESHNRIIALQISPETRRKQISTTPDPRRRSSSSGARAIALSGLSLSAFHRSCIPEPRAENCGTDGDPTTTYRTRETAEKRKRKREGMGSPRLAKSRAVELGEIGCGLWLDCE